MSTLAIAATIRRQTNVLSHMLGHLKKHLDSASKQELVQAIEDYRQRSHPPRRAAHAAAPSRPYSQRGVLAGQTYLAPDPRELMLRYGGSGASPEGRAKHV